MATTRRASEAIRSGAPYASITSIRVHSIPRDQRLLRVRPKSARQARFVVINFGHYVGCIEGTTRLRSIGGSTKVIDVTIVGRRQVRAQSNEQLSTASPARRLPICAAWRHHAETRWWASRVDSPLARDSRA